MNTPMIRLGCKKIFSVIGIMLALAVTTCASEPKADNREAMDYTDATVLGAVEGITEYLPISSTGHLILAENLLGLDDDGTTTDGGKNTKSKTASAVESYCIVIQAGAIAAVVILYWKDLWLVILGMLGRSREGFKLGFNLLLAFLPAAILGFLFDDMIEEHLFGPIPVAIALAMGAPIMLGVEAWRKRKMAQITDTTLPEKELHDITPSQAIFVGFLQTVAMWPGTSRSMMTITGGYLIGLTPAKSARFSFLLGFITLSAATAYTLLKHGKEMSESLTLGPAIVGILVATITAALSIKWLVGFLSRNGLSAFAYYRIVVSIIIAVTLCM